MLRNNGKMQFLLQQSKFNLILEGKAPRLEVILSSTPQIACFFNKWSPVQFFYEICLFDIPLLISKCSQHFQLGFEDNHICDKIPHN